MLLLCLLFVGIASAVPQKNPWDVVWGMDGKTGIGEERRCWTDRNGDTVARWYNEGEQIDRGTLFYECRDAKLVPAGCLDSAGRRVPFDGTYKLGADLVQCARWGGTAQPKRVGCIAAGRTYRIGESWTEAEAWRECAVEGEATRARLGGCVDAASQNRLRIGQTMDRGQTTFECQSKGGDAVGLVPIGCVATDGSHHRVGQQWQDGDFLFYCKKTNEGACERTCIGCVVQGRRLYDGDRMRDSRAVLQCEVRPKRHALNQVACVSDGGVERVLDCQWNDPSRDGTYRVKRQCVLRTGRATIDTLGCVFEKDGYTRLTLKLGTYTMWRESMDRPPLGVLCRSALVNDEEWPRLETFAEAERAQRTNGLTEDVELRV